MNVVRKILRRIVPPDLRPGATLKQWLDEKTANGSLVIGGPFKGITLRREFYHSQIRCFKKRLGWKSKVRQPRLFIRSQCSEKATANMAHCPLRQNLLRGPLLFGRSRCKLYVNLPKGCHDLKTFLLRSF